MTSVWGSLLDKPLFAVTSDQDWAPEWAVEIFLEELRRFDIPLHMFRTNPCKIIESAVAKGVVEQGWHPNFLPGSSHGDSIEEVIGYCRRNFPGATTVRSHCFAEDTFRWRALSEAGIRADSQLGTLFQGYLLPVIHWTGIVRLPVYFEDDTFFDLDDSGLNLDSILPTLFTPGLKILNFHPTFVGCNTPSRAYHEERKPGIFANGSTADIFQWNGRGTLTVFRELIELIRSAGHDFHRFQSLVDLASTTLQSSECLIPPTFRTRLLL